MKPRLIHLCVLMQTVPVHMLLCLFAGGILLEDEKKCNSEWNGLTLPLDKQGGKSFVPGLGQICNSSLRSRSGKDEKREGGSFSPLP